MKQNENYLPSNQGLEVSLGQPLKQEEKDKKLLIPKRDPAARITQSNWNNFQQE